MPRSPMRPPLHRAACRRPRLRDVTAYWSAGNAAPLRSAEGHSALVVGQVTGPAFTEINSTNQHDLARAEMIAVPITAMLLVVVFGRAESAAALNQPC